jgi:hypothetical protein
MERNSRHEKEEHERIQKCGLEQGELELLKPAQEGDFDFPRTIPRRD